MYSSPHFLATSRALSPTLFSRVILALQQGGEGSGGEGKGQGGRGEGERRVRGGGGERR